MKHVVRLTMGSAYLLFICGVVSASGAGFTITAGGKDLGPVDESSEIPVYHMKMTVGQTMQFNSQGVVIPRGQAAQPSEADAAAWLFDDAAFELMPNDKKKADKTTTSLSLKALKAGKSRLRFVGNILGYDRKYDVMVEVSEK